MGPKLEGTDVQITVGAIFRRVCSGEVVETAKVLSVAQDPAGVPRVRYSVRYGRSDVADDLCTLALASFNALFREQVNA